MGLQSNLIHKAQDRILYETYTLCGETAKFCTTSTHVINQAYGCRVGHAVA
jgi:L-lysine 2,3-aminomutase